MSISDKQVKEYMKQLLLSRMRILLNHGFYGLLLMHMKFELSERIETAATDGTTLVFSPSFLDELSDSELDFIMMHEILHVVLQHCTRDEHRDHELFNVACDIVVNSNILYSNDMQLSSITLRKYGESMHLTPDGREGYGFTAEEIYEMLLQAGNKTKIVDDHSLWGQISSEKLGEDWNSKIIAAGEAMIRKEAMTGKGTMPLCAVRLLKNLTKPHVDWRTILNDFVQEEINDYSFFPPDRRYGDSPFFLPDFNEKDEYARDILFMIDTSGSISDEMMTKAFSEIKGAIEQFDGKLQGWLGFFDADVVPPQQFESVEELKRITPRGGGGTSFKRVFEYLRNEMSNIKPQSIIILTDGYDRFPKEEAAGGIPVLWIISNDRITPPWGKVCRIEGGR